MCELVRMYRRELWESGIWHSFIIRRWKANMLRAFRLLKWHEGLRIDVDMSGYLASNRGNPKCSKTVELVDRLPTNAMVSFFLNI